MGPLHDPVTIGTKLHILVSKLRSETSKPKAGSGELVRVALFWKFHCATCSPVQHNVYVILYHVTESCKESIFAQTKTCMVPPCVCMGPNEQLNEQLFEQLRPFLHGSGQIVAWTKTCTVPPCVYTGPAKQDQVLNG